MNEKILDVKPIQSDLTECAANAVQPKTIFSDRFFKVVTIVFELALIVATIYLFQLERNHGFLRLLPSLFFGFIVYSLLPFKFRLPFLFILSVFTFTFIIGLWNTFLLMAIGSALILVCHLPIAYSKRIVMVLLAGALLAAIRIHWIETSWGSVILPLVGSMFMFRLILYQYELGQKDQEPASIWQRLCYFFLLPNICFPLFPIIDYKTYLRTYFNEEEFKIYQKGINWIFRGVTQLILYRIVYYYWVPSPIDVVDTGSLVVYLLTSYLLLLKISGQAHLIIGTLCLFGFNLPAIFNKYFLANGFNDFWRRINIYWKDFVMKVFYYRVFFIFRKWGLKSATAITLLFIFGVTWFLHSYQYFWLEGRFPITRVDGLFWGIFGVLVAINSLVQISHKNKKSLGTQKWSLANAFKKSFQIVSFFTFMCVLWSLWQSGSLPEWLSTVSAIKEIKGSEICLILLVLASTTVVGTLIQYPISKFENTSQPQQGSFYKNAIVIVILTSTILGCRLYGHYGLEGTNFAKFVNTIKEPKLNKKDAEAGERGYYGALLGAPTLTNEFNIGTPEWENLNVSTGAIRLTNNLLLKELLPDKVITFKGAKFSTNKWGMRDQDYELQKPSRTYRIVSIGSSIEMGAAVDNKEVFESLVEDRLNNNNQNEKFSKYEILNFAVGGYDLVNNVKVVETKVFAFHPDALIYFGHTNERWRVVDRFYEVINSGVDLEYDFLNEIEKRAGVERGLNRVGSMKRLLPYSDEILQWGYKRIVEKCKKNNSVPVFAVLPHLKDEILREDEDELENADLIDLAAKTGFVTIDLTRVYRQYDPSTLVVSSLDAHPNPKGHRLIADLLYEKIMEKRDSLRLGNQRDAKNP